MGLSSPERQNPKALKLFKSITQDTEGRGCDRGWTTAVWGKNLNPFYPFLGANLREKGIFYFLLMAVKLYNQRELSSGL